MLLLDELGLRGYYGLLKVLLCVLFPFHLSFFSLTCFFNVRGFLLVSWPEPGPRETNRTRRGQSFGRHSLLRLVQMQGQARESEHFLKLCTLGTLPYSSPHCGPWSVFRDETWACWLEAPWHGSGPSPGCALECLGQNTDIWLWDLQTESILIWVFWKAEAEKRIWEQVVYLEIGLQNLEWRGWESDTGKERKPKSVCMTEVIPVENMGFTPRSAS